MKKFSFFICFFIFCACKKEKKEYTIPTCIQDKVDFYNSIDYGGPFPTFGQYEYNNQDYYLIVFGTLDNGSGYLLNNNCDTLCTVTDNLTCPNLSDFWPKATFIKRIN